MNDRNAFQIECARGRHVSDGVSTALRSLLLGVGLFSALALAPSTAEAQRRRRTEALPVVEQSPAEVSRRAAQQAFAAGEFAEAERLFLESFEQEANPLVMIGVADARERQGDAPGAVEALERYLALRAEAPDRNAVEARIATLRTQRGVVLVTSEPPGEVWLDGERSGYVTPVELTLTPGEHVLAVTYQGEVSVEHVVAVPFGARTTLDLVNGDLVDGDSAGEGAEGAQAGDAGETDEGAEPVVDGATESVGESAASASEGGAGADPDAGLLGDGEPLSEAAAGTSPAEAAATFQPRRAAGITAGIAVGTVVVGTVLGFMALTEHSDFDERPTAATADRGERLALFSDVMFGVAGIAAVTSIVLYVTDKRDAERAQDESAESANVRVMPVAGRRLAGVAASVEF